MTRSGPSAALVDHVVQFQEQVERLAFAVAREIIEQELERRVAEARRAPALERPASPRGARRGRPPAVRAAAGGTATSPPPGHEQLALPLAAEAAPVTEAVPAAPRPAPANGRERRKWTREAIVDELATWMLSGTAIDAAFVTRHGPPGLVAAARRIFGRFEAALNVAGLRVSELYPDGQPPR